MQAEEENRKWNNSSNMREIGETESQSTIGRIRRCIVCRNISLFLLKTSNVLKEKKI